MQWEPAFACLVYVFDVSVCVRVALVNFPNVASPLTVKNVTLDAWIMSVNLVIIIKLRQVWIVDLNTKWTVRRTLSMTESKTITINNKEYVLDDLSDAAKAQLVSLQVTDQEIIRLQQQQKIAQTARNAYAQALSAELPEDDWKISRS